MNSEITSSGLVGEIANYIWKRTDTNPSFAETCAAALVATAIGPNVVVPTRMGDNRLNVFGICVGGTGISNKTVALDIVRLMARGLGKKLERRVLLPSKFSIEGLANYLATETNWGLIVGDEFTTMITQRSKTWLSDIMEFLSKLWDGYIPQYVTIQRGVEGVPFVYVNFLSATTFYLAKLLKREGDDFFIQGTGCRFLWDLDFRRELMDEDPSQAIEWFLDPFSREELMAELDGYIEELALLHSKIEEISEISQYKDGIFILRPTMEAAVELYKYRVETINRAICLFNKDLTNPDSGYIARLAQNAIKLAGVHYLGRVYQDLSLSNNEELPQIELEDVRWAIKKMEHHFRMYVKLKEISEEATSKLTSGYQADWQKVLDTIDSKGGKASISDIMKRTRWKSKHALEILQSMILAKIIESKRIKPPRSKEHVVYVRYGAKIPEVEKWLVRDEEASH